MSTPEPLPLPRGGRRRPPQPPDVALALATPGERTYRIVHDGQIVGITRLECRIPGSRSAAGRLTPGEALPAVMPDFRAFPHANTPADLRRFLTRRDRLRLRLLDAGGREMDARVELISEWAPRVFVAHVAIEDPVFWENAEC